MKKKVKAFIEIGKNLDFDICSEPEADVSFMLLGQGKTVSEAKQDFFDCFDDLKKSYNKQGKYIPEVEFEFVYDIPSFLKYSPFPLTWLSNATSINKKQLSHYTTERKHPNRVTLGKIQNAVNNFVADFSQVRFI
jgi:predicted RNase H-like HicB family nuclease